jgi:hypothetical protein
MVNNCLEMPYGSLRHFPAGTYDKQMSTETGRIELELMKTVHSVWYTFGHLSMSDWGENERRVAKYVMPDTVEPPEPTRRLDNVVASLWGVSLWVFSVMMRLRDLEDG